MTNQATQRHTRRGIFCGVHRLLGGWRRCVSGATAVEFGMILPVFLIFVMGLVEFGRLFWVQANLRHAVEQTARSAMAEYTREFFVNDNFSTWFSSWTSSLEAGAADEAFGLNATDIVFTATTSQTSGIDYVSVSASYDFEYLFPVVPGMSSQTLTALSKTPLIK